MSISESLEKATLLRNQGHGEEAAEIYLQVAERLTGEGKKEESAECFHMAGVSLKHSPREAEKYFDKAIQIRKLSNDHLNLGRILRDQAIIYLYQDDYQKALELLNQSEKELRLSNSGDELAITIAKQGLVLGKMQNFESAETKFDEAEAIFSDHPNGFYEMTTSLHYAELAFMQGNYDEVIKQVDKGISQLSRDNTGKSISELEKAYTRRFIQLYGLLGNAYCRLGDRVKGLDYFNKAIIWMNDIEDEFAVKVLLNDIGARNLKQEFSINIESERIAKLLA